MVVKCHLDLSNCHKFSGGTGFALTGGVEVGSGQLVVGSGQLAVGSPPSARLRRIKSKNSG